ncbi:MAG TPA: SAM-dependent methyltransferase [Streptosporangiaceae bacterium]
MTSTEQPFPAGIPTDVPTPARMYDYGLGGKDNYAIDRQAALAGLADFPEILDIARENRLFLYRAVRWLSRDAGIRQFLDMGSGLPAQQNVHQVAQQFRPDARVVYVDNDPIVLAHGRALLADGGQTTVIMADMTDPRHVLAHPDVRRLFDFDQPVAALFLSVGHSITDDAVMHAMLSEVADALVAGSFIALSQIVGVDQATADEHNEVARRVGLPWKNRTAEKVSELLSGLEPVPPGLVDVVNWRPDPNQPPLRPVDKPLRPFLGAAASNKRLYEFGGIMRKP